MRSVLAVVVLSLVAGVVLPSARAQPPGSSSGWETSTPEKQGIDSDILADMLLRMQSERLAVRSVLIIRNDTLVLECYTHPYDRDVVHDVKSVSKSIISALVGVALREGIVASLDQPVCNSFPEYLPENSDPRKRRITLQHLLTMSSGLDLDENGPAMQAILSRDDWIAATFARPMVAPRPSKRNRGSARRRSRCRHPLDHPPKPRAFDRWRPRPSPPTRRRPAGT